METKNFISKLDLSIMMNDSLREDTRCPLLSVTRAFLRDLS